MSQKSLVARTAHYFSILLKRNKNMYYRILLSTPSLIRHNFLIKGDIMIALQQCRVALSDTFSFFTEQFVVQPLQHVALVGANGSGKSALAAVLAGKGEVVEGERLVSVSTG